MKASDRKVYNLTHTQWATLKPLVFARRVNMPGGKVECEPCANPNRRSKHDDGI